MNRQSQSLRNPSDYGRLFNQNEPQQTFTDAEENARKTQVRNDQLAEETKRQLFEE
jgi:hypothetical protein